MNNMNKPLTLKETIEKHRKLWNWIANETEKRQKIVLKEENPMVQKDKPQSKCYCCQFVIEQTGCKGCEICPLNWGKRRDGFFSLCTDDNTLYKRWNFIIRVDNENWEEAAKLAREIANLPLKPEYQKMLDKEKE